VRADHAPGAGPGRWGGRGGRASEEAVRATDRPASGRASEEAVRAAHRPLSARASEEAVRAAHRPASGGDTWRRWAPHLAFNGGRILGFAALGALTGLLGSAVTLSGVGLAVAMLAVAVVMTLLGIQLSGASPRLAGGLLPTLPDVLSSRLQRTADRTASTGQSAATAAAVGAATYLLPCGFTQAVQLYALSTGDAAQGAAIMAAFAVGTTPGLLAIAGLSVGLRGRWAVRFGRFAAVAVLAFAVVNATGAVGILRGGVGGGTSGAETISANVRVEDGVQYVTTTQVADGYEPATAVVQTGIPVVWQVTSEALTCASWLRAPDLGVPQDAVLTPGETSEFRFTPQQPGTIRYSCGMGMYWGSFEVIAAAASAADAPA
jgi:sulfite exporter TauE/SafE